MSSDLPISHESSLRPKRIIMILGVQRSGTTALFEALATAPGVTARNESPQDDLFANYFLLPEPRIREVLAGLPGTILLKPVRESERRSPKSIADEYADYDLKMIWLYRDPVNVFDSYLRKGWLQENRDSAQTFAIQWRRRNLEAIIQHSHLGGRMLMICYEDLVNNADQLPRLGEALGLQINSRFGSDSANGRLRLPEPLRSLIDQETLKTRARLDQIRSLDPVAREETPGHSADRSRSWFGDLWVQFRRLTSPKQTTATAVSDPQPKGPNTQSTIVFHSDYSDVLYLDDPSTLYADWLAAGPLRQHTAENIFVSLGYETSQTVFSTSRPIRALPSLGMEAASSEAFHALKQFFAANRSAVRARLSDIIDRWMANLAGGQTHQLDIKLPPLAIDLIATWLGVSRNFAEQLFAWAANWTFTAAPGELSSGRESLGQPIPESGLVAELISSGVLTQADVPAFLCDTALPLLALPTVVSNALWALGKNPDRLATARDRPEALPELFTEALRLAPMWFSLKRRMNQSLSVHGHVLPQDAVVEVFLATANRDPEAFPAPDEFRPGRQGPAPLLWGSPVGGFTALDDNPPWGCPHLLFDLSLLVLTRLLTGPSPLRLTKPPHATRQPMPSGDVWQTSEQFEIQFE